jgi:dTDP-4-amino-4,6-dideoxygalactose transaminase
MIQFLDLKKVNDQYRDEIDKSISAVINSGWYIQGDSLKGFEEAFAEYCGTRYAVGVANGLEALSLTLRAWIELGKLQTGDEVLVPSHTFIASILAISHTGLKPVLVEPSEKDFNIDLADCKSKLSSKTKVIMPVHLYGQLAPMLEVLSFAKEHGLLVLEDAAQAHGAIDTHSGKRAGNMGDAAGFSFYPGKNLGALGDGGAITTNDEALNEALRCMRNYGAEEKYIYRFTGYNSRLDEIQAAILHAKLKGLDKDNARRMEIASQYLKEIKIDLVQLPFWSGAKDHVFHLFVVRVANRNAFMTHMKELGVMCSIHYPVPPHHQKAYPQWSDLNLPLTEQLHAEVVSLPISPVHTDEEIDKVISAVNAYHG